MSKRVARGPGVEVSESPSPDWDESQPSKPRVPGSYPGGRAKDDGTISVPLSQGKETLVTGSTFARLAPQSWHAVFLKSGGPTRGAYYALGHVTREDGKPTTRMLSRVLLAVILGRPLLRSELVDHINHDTLDNRDSNLRLATNGQSAMNRGGHRTSRSGFKGVVPRNGRWLAAISCEGRKYHLGTFQSVHLAAVAYDLAALKHHGQFAKTNFPIHALGTAVAHGTLNLASADAAIRKAVQS